MIKISKKIEYSLICLKYLAQKQSNDLTSAREISDHFNLPFDTTSRVLQMMNSAELVSSIHGPKGGYFLEKNLSQISYMQLCQIIENKEHFIDCEPCEISKSCNISAPLKNLNTAIINFFEGLTLDQLLNQQNLIEKTLNLSKENNELN